MEKDLLDYFIKRTDERFDQLEEKIDTLIKFKWQIIGGAAIVSLMVTFAMQVFLKTS